MDYHSHTAGDVGAAPEGHHHSAYDVGAAEDNHTHYPHEVGASPQGHEHQLHQIAGAASEQDVRELERQVQQLSAGLEAERRLNAELRNGAVTIPALASAIRNHARYTEDDLISFALNGLADTIEREART
jgi:hypothetical protein